MSTGKRDTRQISFEFFAPSPAPESAPDRSALAAPLDRTLRHLVAETLDHAHASGRDREAVAAAMSARLGRKVSKTQLDQWAAPSQPDRRIPADALGALCAATQDWRALHGFVEACGFRALTPQEAICAEFGALHAVRRHLDQKARAIAGDMEDLVAGLMDKMKREVAS